MKTMIVLLLTILSASAIAHHSRIQYDTTAIREMHGEIISVRWRNPHVMYTLRTNGNGGDEEEWKLEAGSIYMLGRTGITEDRMQIGDQV